MLEKNCLQGQRQSLELAYPALVRWPEKARLAAFLLGKCYQELGNRDEQLGAYKRALSDDPFDPLWLDASEGIANALLALNKLDEAAEVYRRLIPRAPAARIVVARLLLARNMNLPKAQQDWREVEQLLSESARLFPTSTDVAILESQALAAGAINIKKPAQSLEKLQDDSPTNVSLWISRAGLARAKGKPEDALQILDLATKKAGDGVDLRLARLPYVLQNDDKSAVKQSLAMLEESAEKFSSSERQRLWQGLAQAYTTLGYLDKPALAKAQQMWEQVAAQRPNDLTVQANLFDLALLNNDDDARLGALLQKIRNLDGEKGTNWRLCEATRLINRAERSDKADPSQAAAAEAALKEARPLLASIASQRQAWSRVPACQGRCEQLAGNFDAAIRYYLIAIELEAVSPMCFWKPSACCANANAMLRLKS